MSGAVEFLFVNLRIRNHLRGIEHSETHSGGEQANERSVHRAFRQISLLHSFNVGLVVVVVFYLREKIDALVVHAALERNGRGLRLSWTVTVTLKDIVDSAAVRDDVSLELPRAAKRVLQQKLVSAGRLAVDAVVCAHHRPGVALHNRRAKCRRVCVFLVMLADVNVSEVARWLRPAVYGKVFGSGDHAIIMRIVALHAGDESNGHTTTEERIFPIGLLAATPARVAEDIDVRGPKVKTFKDVRVPGAHILGVFDPALNSNSSGHLVNARSIECRRETDRLGEFCGAVRDDAMQSFAPPVISWNVETRNRPGLINQLRSFFLKCHPMDEIRSALLRRELGIHVRKIGIVLRGSIAGHERDAQSENCQHESSEIIHTFLPMSCSCDVSN